MTGPSPKYYKPSFMEIDPVPEKIFEGFFTIYGDGLHLGHVTMIISINFHFLVPKSLHTKFDKTGQVRKARFNFDM